MRLNAKYRVVALLLAVVLAMGAVPALAAGYPFSAFTTADLRLRQQPSDSAAILLTIPKGDAVLVTGETGNYYIVAYEGREGFALKAYISLEGGGQLPQGENENPPVSASSPYVLLYSGSEGAHVKALQEALGELGFYSGTADGKFGAGTKSAVLAFQQKNNLYQTGTADAATQELLYEGKPLNSKDKATAVKTVPAIAGATISSGSRGDAVRTLQTRLRQLGYYTGSLDGECGSGTVTAIKAFQKKAGLKQTGTADADTQTLLYADSAPAANATATPKPTKTPTPAPIVTPVPQPATYPFNTYTLASVNMRQKASVSSTRLLTVPQGGEVTVLALEGDFVRATYNQKTGYLMAQYVNIPSQYLPGKALDVDVQAQQDYAYLQFGSSGSQVRALQDALRELGFYSGATDGNFGSGTASALKSFQQKNGLKQDGIASPEVQKLIYENKPFNSKGKKTDVKTLPPIEGYDMQLNDRGDAVRVLQEKLQSLGYYTGALGTLYDSATEKAVRAFQKDHSLTVDGKAGPKTQRMLNVLTATAAPTPYTYATPKATAQPVSTPLTQDNIIVIQNGTRGLAVTRLQNRLMELGYYTCTADGIYDSDDIAAVREFQRKNGLKIDGIAGLDTQQRLYSDSAIAATTAALPTPTPPSLNQTPRPGATLPSNPYPLSTPDTSLTLRPGSEGEAVRSLQERLVVLGYYAADVDGKYGSGTSLAVTTFQRAHGLVSDGVAGPQTLSLLYSANARPLSSGSAGSTSGNSPSNGSTPALSPSITLQSGDRGEEVRVLQQRLVQLGYLTTADGIYGPKTYNAVVNFQKRNGLRADGIAGKNTLTKINSSSAVAAAGATAPAPTATPAAPSTGTTNNNGGFTVPDPAEVRYANWYSEIRARARLMPDVVVYDPDTGLRYNLHMFSFGKHVDCEPPTAADTAIMNQVCGENSWTPKYVWIIFSDGRVYIASTHSHGHEVDHTSGNDLTGHICVHFPRIMSEAEATGPYAVSHQKEILYGWELTQAMIH